MSIIEEIEKYAKENDIPIMQKEGIEFLTNYIKENNIKTILEIGTAIGYSAIKMALGDPKIKVVTIEKDEKMYQEAIKNISDFGLDKRITVIYADALNINIEEKFNMIFIDGAKGQYIKFFEKYQNNLKRKGVIVTDNMNFYGLVKRKDPILSKSLNSLVNKIRDYRNFLEKNPNFTTKFYDVGDGIAISIKK
ncbi:MAG: O-methyltransferase [Mollicutes bacterium]|nr:O-methyltransferase [Mollicutes bacterium]